MDEMTGNAGPGWRRARAAVTELLDGSLRDEEGNPVEVLRVAGAPRSGKTTFALDAFVRAMGRWREGGHDAPEPVMVASGRVAADTLNGVALRRLGVVSKRRPVGTLNALAFDLLTRACVSRARAAHARPRLPKLLNGAEQEAAIRAVLRIHVDHAGEEDCPVCSLMRDYFQSDSWTATLVVRQTRGTRAIVRERITPGFVSQLRDAFARLNELGVADEASLAQLAGRMDTDMGWRELDRRRQVMMTRFRLVFVLRDACDEWVRNEYPGEYRLDSSRLLVEAKEALADAGAVPPLVVVDDWQDVTLAGAAFLEALAAAGSRLLLVGCDDEAVQSFRGSYPEALTMGALGRSAFVELDERPLTAQDGTDGMRYIDRAAARVSQNIGSVFELGQTVGRRPGKLHAGLRAGASPFPAVDGAAIERDRSVRLRVLRTGQDAALDMLWQIKRRHLCDGEDWNSMAVIAHDNGTLRALGERFEREGIPVIYSRVTKPLKDEPVVQGLFALIDLARPHGDGDAMRAQDVRRLFAVLLSSPLVMAGGARPVRVRRLDSALMALGAMDRISRGRPGEGDAWKDAAIHLDMDAVDRPAEGTWSVDDLYAALLGDGEGPAQILRMMDRVLAGRRGDFVGGAHGTRSTDADADGSGADGARIGDAREGGRRDRYRNADIKALAHAVSLIGATRARLGANGRDGADASAALWAAWDSCAVAEAWQEGALGDDERARACNERLDVAMRLFETASTAEEGVDIARFMARVRESDVAADSLAHVGPVQHAVTLTTPAGAAGRSWQDVWLTDVQQGVWPNLAPRDTVFGVEDLADIRLRGRLSRRGSGERHDERLLDVLYGELRGFLVALTRATGTVHIGVVWNEDEMPSNFLFDYLFDCPGRNLRRVKDIAQVGFDTVGVLDGKDGALPFGTGGLETTARGLVAVARRVLAERMLRERAEGTSGGTDRLVRGTLAQDAIAADAAGALACLSDEVMQADPAHWQFVPASGDGDDGDGPDGAVTDGAVPGGSGADDSARAGGGNDGTTVRVNPSGVDAAWECPLHWAFDQRMSGPRPGQVSAAFGTLIHAVAQQASQLRYDRLVEDGGVIDPACGIDGNIQKVTSLMRDLYDGMRAPEQPSDPVDARILRRNNEAKVNDMLANIATYFVSSVLDPQYLRPPQKSGLPENVGKLRDVDCEAEFDATFTMDDLRSIYERSSGAQRVSSEEFAAALDTLAGGFAPGTRDIAVRLTGRIDRKEVRERDGATQVRVIDYKTGHKKAKQGFNDLQLVCYQLGLGLPTAKRSKAEGSAGPVVDVEVSRSMLFAVGDYAAPANNYGPERAFQPRLFRDGGLDGVYEPRSAKGGIERYHDSPLPGPSEAPVLAGIRGTQMEWCLTMLARVLYAAGYMRDGLPHYPAKLGPACRYCAFKNMCPLWPDASRTVMED